MSMFYCNRCDCLIDGDETESVDDSDGDLGEICCLECLNEEEREEEHGFDESVKNARRDAFVNKMESEIDEDE